MITNKELNTVKLSPTKKDFYQIWNELLDTASKISERWDPTSTNESDPGIILLKVLTAVADKLNYNIDANTLEAFMPSAAQEDSMRKLTEMMGYAMKYYQSATTEVQISYNKHTTAPINGILTIDRFTNIKDIDDSINYITLEQIQLNKDNYSKNVSCMEGELVECETDDNNVVSMFHLDDNRRYFLPETQIAENGIFVTNISKNVEGEEWKKVTNINAQGLGEKIYKFGFDSKEGLPYIQFPEDISTLIEDGLRIKYVRTSGVGGNISLNTLSKMETPLSWTAINSEDKQEYHNVDNFSVKNVRASTNGTNKEGLNSAYNNFKKTVGTFDTLVTCRDYMNKIYQLVSETDNTTPLVSNIIVSDIRDDINRAATICTFTNRGVEYKVVATAAPSGAKTLTHFDLMIYPFKSTYGLNSKAEFDKSFDYSEANLPEILSNLEENKTLAHNFVSPIGNEITCIKNFYKLRAKVNTVRKVGVIEQTSILNNIFTALFKNFNMRQLDFGEEIPYDVLLSVMENADDRIKSISLDDPELSTRFCTVSDPTTGHAIGSETGNKLYNKLVLNNVLAGRVPLFNYNENFKPEFNESQVTYNIEEYDEEGESNLTTTDKILYNQNIHKLQTELAISGIDNDKELNIKLEDNEVIQFIAPSLKTIYTYPAYVNYYLHLDTSAHAQEYIAAVPATMQTLGDFLKGGPSADSATTEDVIEFYVNETNFPSNLITALEIDDSLRQDTNESREKFKEKFNSIKSETLAIFVKEDGKYKYVANDTAGEAELNNNQQVVFYTFVFAKDPTKPNGISDWRSWLVSLNTVYVDSQDPTYSTKKQKELESNIEGIYLHATTNYNASYGKLIDDNGKTYRLVVTPGSVAGVPFNYYYVPRIWNNTVISQTSTEPRECHTADGLGQNSKPIIIAKNTEYQLKTGEYLIINYTKSDENDDTKKHVVVEVYHNGEIIKPNFDIEDSYQHSINYSYTKNFTGISTDNISSVDLDVPPGLFTLGSEEQIELRDFIQVELNDQVTNLYWTLQQEQAYNGTRVIFPFNEEPVDKETGEAVIITDANPFNPETMMYSAYTLKEGEYLFYTDMNKSDIAFYGFGTTIVRGINTPEIIKYTSDNDVSAEEVSATGLTAAIPWRTYNLSDEKAGITVRENQYINLTKGDTLITLKRTNNDINILNNIPVEVETASYKFANDVGESILPDFNIQNIKWRVRSKFELHTNPIKSQLLRNRTIGDINIVDKLSLLSTKYKTNDTETDTIISTVYAVDKDNPISIKTNKIINSTESLSKVTTVETDADGNVQTIKADLELKLFKENTLKVNNEQILNLNNFGDGTFTYANIAEYANNLSDNTQDVEIPLHILLPENSFGLLMIHCSNQAENNTPLEATIEVVEGTPTLSLFNQETAWDKKLKEGLQIIKITDSCSLKIKSGNNKEILIIFGNLDIIPTENQLNPKLCYKGTDSDLDPTTGGYTQILRDIKAVDTEGIFYYNMPIAGNLDIDMNPNDSKDTMENPLNWYNPNNVNSKYVISVLKTDEFKDNITIAKSSRSMY